MVRDSGEVISCNAAFAILFGVRAGQGGFRLESILAFEQPCTSLPSGAPLPFPALPEGDVGARFAFRAAGKKAISGFLRCFPAEDNHFVCFVEETSSRQSQKDFLQLLVRLSIEADMPLEKMLGAALRSFCENFDFARAAILELDSGHPTPFTSYPGNAGQRLVEQWADVHAPRRARMPDTVVLGDTPLSSYQAGKWIYFPLFISRLRWGYLVLEGRSVASVKRLTMQETFLRSIIMWLSGRLSEFTARRNLIALNEEMQVREESFRTLYRSTPAMMHWADDDNCIMEVSDRWLEVLGYSREEVIGRRAYDFLTPISRQYNMTKVRPDFLRNNLVQSVPLTMLRKNNTPVEVEASAVRCQVAGGFMQSFSVLVDVSERNRALKEIEEKRVSLTKANNSLRKFTYIASHDFQEPLRKMQQFSYLLLQECGGELSGDAQEYLQIIATAAQRMSTLIGDLLLYSRISNSLPDLSRVDLGEIVAAALESEQRHLGIEVPLELRQDILPVIFADRLQVQRLVRAVISNAIKFRDQRRTLRLSVTFEHAPGGSAYNLRFSDNGIGFESRYEDKLFEPLQKLHVGQAYSGTGIGLAIAQAICDNHHWKISGEGRRGEGAAFTVTLPLEALAEAG